MKFVDRVKVFYLYNLRFLRNRQFIRALKTATGIGVLTGTSYWYYTQLNAAIEEKKQRRTGRDSLIAAGVLSQVSGYGENKLAPGKSLQGKIQVGPKRFDNLGPDQDRNLENLPPIDRSRTLWTEFRDGTFPVDCEVHL